MYYVEVPIISVTVQSYLVNPVRIFEYKFHRSYKYKIIMIFYLFKIKIILYDFSPSQNNSLYDISLSPFRLYWSTFTGTVPIETGWTIILLKAFESVDRHCTLQYNFLEVSFVTDYFDWMVSWYINTCTFN